MNVKSIFIGVGLFVSGAGVGAFVANRYLENKWMKAAEMEIHDSMKEFYERQKDDGTIRFKEEPVLDFDDRDKAIAIAKGQKYTKNDELKSQYNLVGVDASEEDDWSALVEAEKREEENEFPEEYINVEEPERDPEPYVISFEDFNNTRDGYDKITLLYFALDDTLTGEDEELDPSLEDHVGVDALDSFGIKSEDPDMVYIRNDDLGIDFEIIKLEKSYREAVLGIHEEPVPVPKRPAKRSKPKTEDI